MLRGIRGKRSVSFNNTEVNFYLKDGELKIRQDEHIEMHDTIAEMMILGNEITARQIYKVYPSTSLLRKHPPPITERFEDLKKKLDLKGIKIEEKSISNYVRKIVKLNLPPDLLSYLQSVTIK